MIVEVIREGLGGQDRATPLWTDPLRDEKLVETLIIHGPGKEAVLASLAAGVGQLDPAGQAQFLKTIFQATALEGDGPITDRRDAAFEILTSEAMRPALQANREVVFNAYLEAVRSQDQHNNVCSGSISTLLELGNAIADCFPQGPQAKRKITAAWTRVYNSRLTTMDDEEQKYFYSQLDDLKKGISPNRQLDSQVERLINQGRSNTQIAKELGLSDPVINKSTGRLFNDGRIQRRHTGKHPKNLP